ncbi:peroxidase 51-like [Elaeis guineensis]|uniref:peroxidase 51-like n=1 Tax=Elaeis guineensis var. tenera TaxID=51953 RepID=UPI00094F5B4E
MVGHGWAQVGGRRWDVLKGRRDGLISKADRVAGNLPQANHTITQLISLFTSKGLTVKDLVALSGGHTIGFSHCKEFMARLYSYNKTFDTNPTMAHDMAIHPRVPCPQAGFDPTIVAANDATTPTIFDNAYYQNLKKGQGLLATDQGLYGDMRTRGYIEMMAKDQQIFFDAFAASMVKLGSIGVNSGKDGEVRLDCSALHGWFHLQRCSCWP